MLRTWLASFIVLTATTMVLGLGDWQFLSERTIGFANGFPGNASEWNNHGNVNNIIYLEEGIELKRVSDKKSYAKYLISVPKQYIGSNNLIQVNATILTQKEQTNGEEPAALMIWTLGLDEHDVTSYTTLVELSQSKSDSTTQISQRVLISRDTNSFYLAFINRDSNGEYLLTKTEVHLVTKSNTYKLAIVTTTIAWIALLCTVVKYLNSRLGVLSASLLTCCIVIATVGAISPERIDIILPTKVVASLLRGIDSNGWIAAYKIGHFVVFFLLTIIALSLKKRLQMSRCSIGLFLIIFAIATEAAQLHLPNRTSSWADLLIDLSAITSAFILFCIIGNLLRKKHPKPHR